MTVQSPRNMEQWIRTVERRLSENRRATGNLTASIVSDISDGIEKDFIRRPTAPIELVYQTAFYTSVRGGRAARLTLDFPDVTKATDGTDVTVSHYELWGRDESLGIYTSTTAAVPGIAAPGLTLPDLSPTPAEWDAEQQALEPYRLITTSTESSFREGDFSPGSLWRFKVRAIGAATVNPGAFSIDIGVQFLLDTTPPPQPTAPLLAIERGTITVRWDGMAVNGTMPADFSYLEVAQGQGSSPTSVIARFTRGGGFFIVSDIPYYKPQFFRFRAVDDSGNAGPWSEQMVGYTTPLVDEDVILSKIDAAKTLLVNVDASVSVLADTVATRHLHVTEDMTAALAEFLHVRAGMIEANAVEADKIAAGAVSAEKLEAELALLTKIIAGDPAGSHAEMTPDGFMVFAADGTIAVKMGTSSDDYFAILSAAGEVAAAIDRLGNLTAQDANINQQLTIRGRKFEDILYPYPLGISQAGWGAQYSNPPAASTQMGIFEITLDLKGDRMYRIHTSPIRIFSNEPNNRSTLRVRWTSNSLGNPPTPTVGSPVVAQAEALFSTSDLQTVQINKITRLDTGRYRFLLCYSSDKGGTAETQAIGSNEWPIEMWVEDIGPYTVNLQVPNSGGGATVARAPVKQEKFYQANGIMSYKGDGTQYVNSAMYQGPSPAGYGNLRSLATFPDMTADLSGATINNIEVYFKFNHWYENDGGTAYIGVHGNTSIPATLAPPTSQITSSGWPKPGSRWLQLPSGVWNNFKTGASRGLTLNGDGTLDSYGYAEPPMIKVTYTK